MTDTNPQQAARRDRYDAAIREAEGWVLDGGQHMLDAVMAVADAEQAELRARVADYENRITWGTACGSCARVLDSSIRETGRAEQAEAAVERVRSVLESEAVVGRTALDYRGLITTALMADAASAPVSPAPADRAALRDRIADAARTVHLRLGPNATAMAQHGEPIILNLNEADALADAVLAVLPEPTNQAAIYAEVADRLAADAEQGDKDGLTRIYRRSAATKVRDWAAELGDAASGPGGVAGETPQPERPRCPHCRMPHGLTPDVAAVCASIRASIAEDEAQQPETQNTTATCPHCKHWYVTSEPGAHEAACPMKPAAVSQPDGEASVCGPAPDECDAETGEPCDKHEREQSHIEGDHSLCRSADCEVLRQS